ncbi:hypothetical protein BKA58DRAFT_284069, partial [Alternaria rosae]|uniref:uncharacterized protein n=1 Tax=Alternaria rosae TaxID=1187941 RepID=UPI001E8E8E67
LPNVSEGSTLYYVSSRHLMLASPLFRAALSPGRWCEGCKKADGRYHITADDWEEEAFLLLMNMLHLRSPQIPKSASLELLTKLGILVDYYDCASAVEFFTTVWLNKLHSFEMQSSYCRELMLWIWVSSVFRNRYLYIPAAEIAIAHCDDSNLRTLWLPIPKFVS